MSVNAINMNQVMFRSASKPMMVEDHSNPQVDKFVKDLKQEIKFSQLEMKITILEDKYNAPDTTMPQRNALRYMLNDAKAELAQMKKELGVG